MGDFFFVSWLISSSRRSQRGRGQAESYYFTPSFCSPGSFAAVKIVPVYVAEYQLSDKITEQSALLPSVNRYTEDQNTRHHL